MGLFSSKTIINVASSVYNLAGDEKDRPIFLQSLIVRNVLSGTKRSLGDTITTGYLNGPGIKFRTFFRWAVDNYDLIGMPTGHMYAGDVINTQTVADAIPTAANESIWVQEARLGESEYEFWAEQWMMRNHPDQLALAWEADFDDDTRTVIIKLPDESEHTFVANDFIQGDKYIFAYYTRAIYNSGEPVEEGIPVPLVPGDPFPDITGYGLVSDDETIRNETLTTVVETVVSYSDSTPDETTTDTDSEIVTATRRVRVYDKETYLGNAVDEDAKLIRRDVLNLIEDQVVLTRVTVVSHDEDIGGGVTKTTTVTTTEDFLEENNEYREDTQEKYAVKWEPLDLYIYRIGTGIAALDDLVEEVADYGQFFPMIPFRLNNEFLSEIVGLEDEYALAKKAFRKGTDGGKYSKIEAELADNEDIGDMDYIYVAYGVPLNVIDKSARRYIFEFFKRLQGDQIGGANSASDFANAMQAYRDAYYVWLEWRNLNNGGGNEGLNFTLEPEPVVPPKPTLPQNEIKIQNLGDDESLNINYDIRITWNFITEGEGNGLGKLGAKKNDIWFEYLGETIIEDPTYTGEGSYDVGNWKGVISDNTMRYDTIRIWWQDENDHFKYIDIAGLVHRNFIYGGKSVKITAKEALEDSEESGFLVPLHYATFRAMRLVDSTQMSTACVFLVINCYVKKKKKWYQSGFFAVIFVIVVAVVSVVLTGGAGAGLLGSHFSVGSTLGLTGMSAAIAGSIANALAALVLTTMVTKLTENMGVFGAIIGAILGIVLTGAIQNFTSGGGFFFDFSQLMRADNILKLLDAGGRGYAAYVQSSIEDMQQDLIKYQEDANNELKRIREQFFEQFGYGGGQIDPMMFVGDNSPVIAESRDTFLARTLMTGSDVAQMSHDLLYDYVELTTTLPNAFT